ncbi:MAG: hypothetical protein IKO47_07355 [Ruminococcus sp.]|nr:hypothetical protein [Ruminococcus sp.]
MLPEEKARVKIDDKHYRTGWYVVDRDEYVPQTTSAIREAMAHGGNQPNQNLQKIKDALIPHPSPSRNA